jgi:hypothetical protein
VWEEGNVDLGKEGIRMDVGEERGRHNKPKRLNVVPEHVMNPKSLSGCSVILQPCALHAMFLDELLLSSILL